MSLSTFVLWLNSYYSFLLTWNKTIDIRCSMTYAVIRSILFMSVFLKINQAYNRRDNTIQVNNQSNILIPYSIICIPNPPSSPLSILSMSISVSVFLSLSMCVSYFVPIFVLCSYLCPCPFPFLRPCPAIPVPDLCPICVQRYVSSDTYNCDPYLAMRVQRSVSCDPCSVIRVPQSMSYDPCPSIHVLLTISCDPCPANQVLRFLSCDPCPAILVLRTLSCKPCLAICVLRSVSCDPCPAIHVLRSMSCNPFPAKWTIQLLDQYSCLFSWNQIKRTVRKIKFFL